MGGSYEPWGDDPAGDDLDDFDFWAPGQERYDENELWKDQLSQICVSSATGGSADECFMPAEEGSNLGGNIGWWIADQWLRRWDLQYLLVGAGILTVGAVVLLEVLRHWRRRRLARKRFRQRFEKAQPTLENATLEQLRSYLYDPMASVSEKRTLRAFCSEAAARERKSQLKSRTLSMLESLSQGLEPSESLDGLLAELELEGMDYESGRLQCERRVALEALSDAVEGMDISAMDIAAHTLGLMGLHEQAKEISAQRRSELEALNRRLRISIARELERERSDGTGIDLDALRYLWAKARHCNMEDCEEYKRADTAIRKVEEVAIKGFMSNMTEAMTPSLRLLSSHSEHGSESDGRLDGRIRRGVDLVEAMDLAGSERRLSADTNDLHGLAGQGGRPALSSVDSPSPDNRVGLSQAIQPYQEPWRPPSETDRRPFSLPNGGADLSLIVSAQQMTFEVFKSVEHLKQENKRHCAEAAQRVREEMAAERRSKRQEELWASLNAQSKEKLQLEKDRFQKDQENRARVEHEERLRELLHAECIFLSRTRICCAALSIGIVLILGWWRLDGPQVFLRVKNKVFAECMSSPGVISSSYTYSLALWVLPSMGVSCAIWVSIRWFFVLSLLGGLQRFLTYIHLGGVGTIILGLLAFFKVVELTETSLISGLWLGAPWTFLWGVQLLAGTSRQLEWKRTSWSADLRSWWVYLGAPALAVLSSIFCGMRMVCGGEMMHCIQDLARILHAEWKE